MKSRANLYRILVLSSFVMVMTAFVHQMFYAMGTIRYVTFSFDPLLSRAACAAIKYQVALCESNGSYNPQSIIATIPPCFSAIKTIDMQQFPQHMALITVKAFEPIVRINDDQLLIENLGIITADYYTAYKIESLQKITATSPLPYQISSSIMAAIKQCISEKVFDCYTFHMLNEHTWYLGDTQDPFFTLCCNAGAIPSNGARLTYDRLKKQIQKKKPTKAKWIADVRFHDQIILSMDKGGRYG